MEVNIKTENVDRTYHFLQQKDRINHLGVLIDETINPSNITFTMSVTESLAIVVSLQN